MDSFVKQLDGSTYQGANCMAAGDAMLVRRAKQNHSLPTGATIRRLTGDTSGGLNMTQVQAVDTRYYGFTPAKYQPMAWTSVLALDPDRPFGICGGYRPVQESSHDASRHRFNDNHFWFVARRTAVGFKIGDPLADGRYVGCPSGFQTYSFSLARRLAGALDLSGLGTTGYRPLGEGKAYVLIGPKDPVAPTPIIDPIVYVRRMVVTATSLAVRGRPRTTAKRLGTLHKGADFTSQKLRRQGGAYFVNGKKRRDWIGYSRQGRTVWVKRAFVKVV